ncbi:hypothetical protein JTE90_021191 [Oedothorax gibbosus]|uniref:Uncharacterized protein n=1 Tax=Oedothorax gibbosus TaxID=931172 RepID=A0AAV6V6N3_9ARAC|nr:hypothetical protein JTE90_021191 [Oedothorax gibbosus]
MTGAQNGHGKAIRLTDTTSTGNGGVDCRLGPLQGDSRDRSAVIKKKDLIKLKNISSRPQLWCNNSARDAQVPTQFLRQVANLLWKLPRYLLGCRF